ncbi:MAG TPA: response regulator [Anaerolineaceae bacterium]|nr:response regulator [Anaerolineaceae bacterium]HPN52748.1 response regulator [Anaerolineaceae bacterium]
MNNLVLIIDDEPSVTEALEALLMMDGYTIVSASSGPEGLIRMEQTPPDVILLDVMMPEMDGYEVCRRIKANPVWKPIPVILVTALQGKENLVRGLDSGADEFLSKPVNGHELRARVRSMLRIKNLYDSLQSSLEMRDDMSHMIVHDMRSPLTIILGHGQMLEMDETNSSEVRERAHKLVGQAQRMNDYLNDMLMLAKMEGGRLSLNTQVVDIFSLINQIVQNYQPIISSRNQPINIEKESQATFVMADTSLLIRVFDNLLYNAIKYTPNDKQIGVRLGHCTQKQWIFIEFYDEGPGIPNIYLEDIFDKFKIVQMRKEGVVQIGLGLAFCKQVIDAHGGFISVRNNLPDPGATFRIEFPDAEKAN